MTVVVAVIAGGVLLFPSLALLFTVTVRGTGSAAGADAAEGDGAVSRCGSPRPASGVAVVLFIVGVGMLNAADAGWAHIIGVIALFGFVIAGFTAIVPRELAGDSSPARSARLRCDALAGADDTPVAPGAEVATRPPAAGARLLAWRTRPAAHPAPPPPEPASRRLYPL